MLGRIVNAFCFWLLAGLAFVLFFIAVIRPPVEDYRYLVKVESDMNSAVELLRQRVADTERWYATLDPKNPRQAQAIERLAQDQLGWTIEGGHTVATGVLAPVRLSDDVPAGDDPDSEQGEPASPSLWSHWTNLLNFTKRNNIEAQRLQLLMAALAISMAFIFFGTPTKHPQRNDE